MYDPKKKRYPRPKLTREQAKRRAEFVRIQPRLQSLVTWLGVRVPKADGTIAVDLADLHMECGEIKGIIERLARAPHRAAERRPIEKQLGRLWVKVENIPMLHTDLTGPVDRLWFALRRKNSKGARR